MFVQFSFAQKSLLTYKRLRKELSCSLLKSKQWTKFLYMRKNRVGRWMAAQKTSVVLERVPRSGTNFRISWNEPWISYIMKLARREWNAIVFEMEIPSVPGKNSRNYCRDFRSVPLEYNICNGLVGNGIIQYFQTKFVGRKVKRNEFLRSCKRVLVDYTAK